MDTWISRLETLCSEYEITIHPDAKACRDLAALIVAANSPVDAVTIELQRHSPYKNIQLGVPGEGNPTDSETVNLAEYVCRICVWRNRRLQVDVEALRKLLVRFAMVHWKPELHDRVSGLLSFQFPKTQELLELTLAHVRGGAYLLFTDLDRFKEVNDKFGQDGGDAAILQFGALLDQAALPDARPIHRSGDEFWAIIFSSEPEEALAVAQRISYTVKTTEFVIKGDSVKLSTTTGLAAAPTSTSSYAEFESLAVSAIKPPAGKQRGKIRFGATSGTFERLRFGERELQLAYCILRTNISRTSPFSSVALSRISLTLVDLISKGVKLDALQARAESIAESLTIDVVPGLLQAAADRELGRDVSMCIGIVDLALAVTHSIYRSRLLGFTIGQADGLDLFLDNDGTSCRLTTTPDDTTVLNVGTARTSVSLTLGEFLTKSGEIGEQSGRRALLIRIGHNEIGLPRELFAEILTVDDRPTRGGGLPDFWEATIARLAGALSREPNVQVTYVLGDEKSAALTVKRLKNVSSWSNESEWMAFKTGMPIKTIEAAADRLNGHLRFVGKSDEIVVDLADVLRARALLVKQEETRVTTQRAFLDRSLSEREFILGAADGCRVATIAHAYPIVTEIVRKAERGWEAKDQAGISLRELTDFKVHLTDPGNQMIPDFYRDESASLEEYFKREFIDAKGTFATVLGDTGQVEPVLQHIAETLRRSEFSATTRRAILIIPHVSNIQDDVAPLGLVCIRIVPRITPTRLRFDFSYVWRTVEALVGFPYSLYGSVRFSQHLTGELGKLLSPRSVELGEVSYVAQSLHMFTDEYGQIIARRIVNDASR
jgi:diguanylate cyclase (GGDEF)-like protein